MTLLVGYDTLGYMSDNLDLNDEFIKHIDDIYKDMDYNIYCKTSCDVKKSKIFKNIYKKL